MSVCFILSFGLSLPPYVVPMLLGVAWVPEYCWITSTLVPKQISAAEAGEFDSYIVAAGKPKAGILAPEAG